MRLVYAIIGFFVTLVALLSLAPLALLAAVGEGAHWLVLRLFALSDAVWSRATS